MRRSKTKNFTKIFSAVTFIAALVFLASTYYIKKSSEVVVAKVNDHRILKSDVERKLRIIFEGQNFASNSQEMKIPKISDLPVEVVQILVKEVYLDKKLIKAAKKHNLHKSEKVQSKINQILRQEYVDHLVKKELSEEKINDKYAEITNDFAGKKEYLLHHIVVKTKSEAKKISQKLKFTRTNPFAKIAKKYSLDKNSLDNGGKLGYIIEDGIVKEIIDAIVNLKKNKISKPIKTKFGWHLVKFSDVRDVKAPPFEAIKDNIREQLSQDAVNNITSKVMKDAKIQILIPLKEAEKKENTKLKEEEKEKTKSEDLSKTKDVSKVKTKKQK